MVVSSRDGSWAASVKEIRSMTRKMNACFRAYNSVSSADNRAYSVPLYPLNDRYGRSSSRVGSATSHDAEDVDDELCRK